MKIGQIAALHVLLAAALLSACAAAGAAPGGGLRLYDSTVSFRHFAYDLAPDHTLLGRDEHGIVETIYDTKVIENEYLKVTLLPGFGGRILSMIYKPTGHEELYQNPVGTPYGMGEGNFYYDWLMVYGGIFPTFPEPEHGKAWCLPWRTRIVSRTRNAIGVEMSFWDDIDLPGAPGKFAYGRTGIICTATVWVYEGSPCVRLQLDLRNTRDEPVEYEYWTCATLAPGSEPGNTLVPATAEIVAPMDRVKSKDDWWPWMRRVDEPIDAARHIFAFKNLATFDNWADMGIAYAYPETGGSYWGVINHENEEGLFRVADNTATPGMKLWTWGYRQSYDADPNDFNSAARPYIELWAGNSPEFFAGSFMAANEEKTWDEYYIPTAGMPGVTYANRDALADLDYSRDEETGEHRFSAYVFTTHPGETMRLLLRVSGDKDLELYRGTFRGDAGKPFTVDITKAGQDLDRGNYAYEMILESDSGEILARSGVPFEVEEPPNQSG